jgi:hypothetical protein
MSTFLYYYKLRMSGAVPPLPHTSLWRDAKLNFFVPSFLPSLLPSLSCSAEGKEGSKEGI